MNCPEALRSLGVFASLFLCVTDIFSRASADGGGLFLPRCAAARFSTPTGFCGRPLRIADSLALVSSDTGGRFFALTLNFARASADIVRPTPVRAFGNTLYPPATASSVSIQCCSRIARSCLQSTYSSTEKTNASAPCLFHEFCSLGLWWPPLRRRAIWLHCLRYKLIALPTYTFPVVVFSIL